MSSRFVRPETKRLEISGGDWLLVKRRLTAGERRAHLARVYDSTGVKGDLTLNTMQIGFSTVLAYLVDWSLTDAAGKLVDIANKPPAEVGVILDSLDPDDFKEIREAVEAHEAAMETERELEKKGRANGSDASAISASPSVAAGALSGSVN